MICLPYRKRPDFFRLNTDSQLSRGLVFAALGQFPGSTLCHDESPCRSEGTLTNMDPPADWVWVQELGRGALDFDNNGDWVEIPFRLLPAPWTYASWLYCKALGAEDHVFGVHLDLKQAKPHGVFAFVLHG
jgi:hypothetical protein